MRVTLIPILALICVSSIFGYAVFWYGGVRNAEWNVCTLALGFLGVGYWGMTPKSRWGPALASRLKWPIFLLPVFVLFQLIPMPAPLLGFISPPRAELLNHIKKVMPGVTLAPISVMPAATISHLLRITAYTLVFVLIRELAWRLREQPWTAVFPVIGIAGLEAILGILQYLANPAADFSKGTYINRDHYAALLGMALPFAVLYPVSILKETRWRLPLAKGISTLSAVLFAVLILEGIIHSLSRMGLITSLCSMILTIVLTTRGNARLSAKHSITIAAGIVFATALIFFSTARLVSRFAEFGTVPDFSAGRLPIWRDSIPIIFDYPLVGCGLGAREYVYLRYKTAYPLWSTDFAHNDYLQIMIELGVIGFLIVAASTGQLFMGSVRSSLHTTAQDRRLLACACSGAMFAILLHSFVDFNLYVPANGYLFAWVAGLSSALSTGSVARTLIDPAKVVA